MDLPRQRPSCCPGWSPDPAQLYCAPYASVTTLCLCHSAPALLPPQCFIFSSLPPQGLCTCSFFSLPRAHLFLLFSWTIPLRHSRSLRKHLFLIGTPCLPKPVNTSVLYISTPPRIYSSPRKHGTYVVMSSSLL